LHVGLDLSRKRVDVCLISGEGELVDRFAVPADRDGVYGLTRRVAVYDVAVRGVVESMNGARFVHDELVKYGWEVLGRRRAEGQGARAAGVQDGQGGMSLRLTGER
jgi:transposase